MNTIFNHLVFAFVLSFICSCSKTQNEQLQSELNHLESYQAFEDLNEKQFLLVLPRTGCTGCIDSAEEFIINDSKRYSNSLNVLLTDIISFKTVKIKFGTNVNNPNWYIDSEDFSNGIIKSTIYPIIIEYKNNKIIKSEFVSPNNPNAIANLYTRLDN